MVLFLKGCKLGSFCQPIHQHISKKFLKLEGAKSNTLWNPSRNSRKLIHIEVTNKLDLYVKFFGK